MNRIDILTAIANGELDKDFAAIREAMHGRKDALGNITRLSIKVGDKIRLLPGRPKYLDNKTGKVVKINPKRVVIDLDERCGRFHRDISCPPEMLEKIE